MKLMYITSDTHVAMAAQAAGVDWIFLDLEILGKQERQGHLDSVISRHTIKKISRLMPLVIWWGLVLIISHDFSRNISVKPLFSFSVTIVWRRLDIS